MTTFTVELSPLTRLETLLPRLLGNVSLARAQIAIDQLRSTIQSGHAERVIFLTAREGGTDEPRLSAPPVAATIAIVQPTGAATDKDREAIATLLHCGLLRDELSHKGSGHEPTDDERLIGTLANALRQQLRKRGVTFLQLATDSEDQLEPISRSWYRGIGLRPLATLEYLSGPVPEPAKESAAAKRSEDDGNSELEFESVDCRQNAPFHSFAQLVDQTYAGTLDCPELSDYRTAAQTLKGYQASGAYNPQLWYRVTRHLANGGSEQIGCLILADHRSQRDLSDNRDADSPNQVIEIVYMGLVPQARGKGLGRRLVEEAMRIANRCRATRLILAVDRRNHHAIEIYEAAGFSPMLRETVWAASIGRAE